MRIGISAESTVDLTKEILKEYDVHTVPFSVCMGDNIKLDGEFDTKEIFEYVAKTKILPKTSAVNEYQYKEHFTKMLNSYDAIIHFSLSSDMSSAYANAQSAAKTMQNVFVIDTRTLSTGIALLCIYASKLAKQGIDVTKICDMCKERIPSLQVSFVLEKLEYLYKGGRCNSLQLFGANLLKLRPEILVKNGKMGSGKKFRGKFDLVVTDYVKDILATFNTPDLEEVFITYTTAEKEIVDNVKNLLTERGFKNIHETNAGATITSHCGEHCLGILYINDGNKIK